MPGIICIHNSLPGWMQDQDLGLMEQGRDKSRSGLESCFTSLHASGWVQIPNVCRASDDSHLNHYFRFHQQNDALALFSQVCSNACEIDFRFYLCVLLTANTVRSERERAIFSIDGASEQPFIYRVSVCSVQFKCCLFSQSDIFVLCPSRHLFITTLPCHSKAQMFKDIYRQYLAGTGIPEWLGQPSPIGRLSPLVKGKQKPRLSGMTFRHLHHLDCISEMFKGSVFWGCNKHMYHGQMYAYHGMGISSDLSCILKFTGIKPEYLLNPHIEVDWEAIAGVLQLMLIKH